MPLSQQGGQPLPVQYTPPCKHVGILESGPEPCPDCGGIKSRYAKRCLACSQGCFRPPIDQETYVVKGVLCRKFPLTQEQYMLVNASDYNILMPWNWRATWSPITKSFYASTFLRINGRPTVLRVHHILFGEPSSVQYDHVDHDTLNNTRLNLRRCTASQNCCHRRPRKSKSGYIGVGWNVGHKAWVATLGLEGRKLYFGDFDDIKDAVHARDLGALRLHGEFAVLNHPEKRDEYERELIASSSAGLPLVRRGSAKK